MTTPIRQLQREVRVLVVDDSIFMRRMLERMIAAMPGVTVVGTATNGLEAVQLTLELRPDVVTMDVEMPRMDGVAAVAEIMRTVPTPVVMLSSLTRDGAETTIRALEAGAVDCLAKPSGLSHELAGIHERLAHAILRARDTRLVRRRPVLLAPPSSPDQRPPPHPSPAQSVAVIGCSTGGPPALTAIVPHLHATSDAGFIIVQHMPAGFTAALARRLDAISSLRVKEAEDGDFVSPGTALVAPGDQHLAVGPDRRVRLTQDPPMHGVRPAVDITLESVATVFGRNCVAAILTGMGKDGAAGAAVVEAAGGQVVVQDEATCVVYGMPRVTRQLTQRAVEAPLEAIPAAIMSALAGVGP